MRAALKTVTAEIRIGAEPMTVWNLLTDLSRYPSWNPLFPEATGEIAVGSRVRLRSVHPVSGRLMTVQARILAAEPGAELRWASGLPGIISGEHSFRLRAVDGGTELVQSESFGGLLVLCAGKVLGRAQTSFEGLNDAIRKQAESLAELA